MTVDKEVATALGDAVGEFVNTWVKANHTGPVPANEILSMLATHAGRLIQLSPDAEHRAHLVGQFVMGVLEASDAPVMVSVLRLPDLVPKDSLATVKPAGRA